jgi:hypothetical protein
MKCKSKLDAELMSLNSVTSALESRDTGQFPRPVEEEEGLNKPTDNCDKETNGSSLINLQWVNKIITD